MLRLLYLLPICFCSTSLAAECDHPQIDRATTLASVVGQKLVPERFLGGKNISSSIDRCQYDEATDAFSLGIHVKWNGVLMTWNSYEIWGEATSNWAGSEISFVLAGGNDRAQELVFWKDVAGQVIEVVK
ncbi:MAG: hypothetical protein ACTHKD_08470 [Devosia sp.]